MTRQRPPLSEPLLTVDEVAALLRVDRSTVYRLRARGLPCYRLGGCVRFRRDRLEAWLEAQRDGDIVVKLTDVSI